MCQALAISAAGSHACPMMCLSLVQLAAWAYDCFADTVAVTLTWQQPDVPRLRLTFLCADWYPGPASTWEGNRLNAAICEMPIGTGPCGVMAVGRCIDCRQAFCPSHRALNTNGPYTNLCTTCLGNRAAQARAADDRKAQEAGKAAERRRHSWASAGADQSRSRPRRPVWLRSPGWKRLGQSRS